MTPTWLNALSIFSLALGATSAAVVIVDLLAGYRQHMAIMNLVWPVTMLYSGPLGLAAYFKIGRLSSHRAMQQLGMLAGFLTSYPVNWWLVRSGIKETM